MATHNDILEKRAKLSDTKQALLEKLLRGRKVACDKPSTIPRREQRTCAPLSFAQQRLWFLNKLEPESAAYNVPYVLRLTGQLNLAAIERSLQEIIKRHEVLRTTFPLRDGAPTQAIAQSLDWSLAAIDLTNIAEATRETEADRLMYEDLRRPFDLGGGPIFRTILLRLREDVHVLLITFHHIICDEWSFDILEKELLSLYESFARNMPPSLPALPIQYADFAVWQRQWMRGEVLNNQLSYWANKLANSPSVLELPTDRPRPAVQTFRGAGLSRVLPQPLCQSLKRLSQESDATLFMTLLTAFKILLLRYTAQEDILVGTPIANRNHIETEGLMGFFLNTLVLRTTISGDKSFLETLRGVRDVALQAYENQELPFEMIVEKLHPERSLSHNPLFQVLFVLLSTKSESKQFSGLTLTHLPVKDETSKFDLGLFISETEHGLRVTFRYSIDLFAQASIARMLGHFEALLEGIVTNPDRRVSDLPLLSQAERNQLIREWNNTETEAPQSLALHQLFEAQVVRTPEAVAVMFESQKVTYRHLNERANRLARYLQTLGVGPETLVAICVERSLEMIIGILGVLKSGAAYVPLDYEYPKERLEFMLQDSRCEILLTLERLKGALPSYRGKVICLEQFGAPTGIEDTPNITASVAGDNIAYCIYTSGSTGRPKGVMVSHSAICNHLLWRQKTFPLTQHDAFLQKASLSFDISVWEIFAPLISGARLVLACPGGQKDSGYLVRLMAEEHVTVAHSGPAMLQIVLEEPELGTCQHLRLIFCGGDQLPVELQKRFFSRLNAELCNQYGPTETTVDATFHLCERHKDHVTVPIGKPISQTQAFILTSTLELAPIGVVGELYIAGASLARGYLNRPDLTGEKFIPNPFSAEPGSRLYRTGDLVRYLPEGLIEFKGRVDYQVKLRGFRIELGEIEAVLASAPGVQDSLAIVREDVAGDRQLVAYVIPTKSHEVSAEELRDFLKQKLPTYMVPSVFVPLATFPLTPSGKIDRRRLPAPDRNRSDSDKQTVEPRTPMEEVLTEVWSKVLGLERVSIHDDFFAVGGHSLLAIQLFSKLRAIVHADLPVRLLFEAPTVAQLARLIDEECRKKASSARPARSHWSYLTPIQALGSKCPFYFLPGGLGREEEFLVYARMARYLGFDQPFYGLKARGVDGAERPHSSVVEMAAAYLEEIKAFQPCGPYSLVGECAGGLVALEIAQQLQAEGASVALVALLDCQCPRRTESLQNTVTKLKIVLRKQFVVRALYHLRRLPEIRSGQRRSYFHEQATKAKHRIASALGLTEKKQNQNTTEKPFKSPRFHAYFQTLIRYRPKPYSGKLTLLINENLYRSRPTLGWTKFARGGLEVHQLPGNHITYIRQHVQSAAEKLKECLDKTRS